MDNRNEQISALMDDELSTAQQSAVIEVLFTNKQAQQTWTEYHLIRDYLQQSAQEVRMRPTLKISQFLPLSVANDRRWQAGIAATVVAFSLWGVWSLLVTPVADTAITPMQTSSAETKVTDNNALLTENTVATPMDASISTTDPQQYYIQTYHHSIDNEGLRQVSYSFE